MEHGLKYIKFYIKKPIAPRAICYNPSNSRQAARGTRICCMGLLDRLSISSFKLWVSQIVAEVRSWMSNYIRHTITYGPDYLSMPKSQLNHFDKRVPTGR